MAKASNVLDLNKLVKNEAQQIARTVAKDAVNEELRSQGLLEEVEEEAEDSNNPFVVDQSSSMSRPTKGIFNSFSSTLGYFGKISKEIPSGDWETKDYTITAPESIPDIEQEVVRLVNEKEWGDGTYFVTIRHPDKKGFHLRRKVIVGELTPREKKDRVIHKNRMSGVDSPNIPWSDPVESSIKMTNQILRTAKEISPTPQPQMDIVKLAEMNANTLKAGMDMANEANKRNIPTTPPPNETSQIVQLITALKDIFKQPEPKEKEDNLLKTVTILKELGILGAPQPKQDGMELLKNVKDTLGFKFAHEVEGKRDDPMNMVEKVGTLITALKPLINPDAGPPSTMQLVMEALSKFGGPLFETIRDFATAKKMEVEYRMSQLGGGGVVNPPTIVRRPPPTQRIEQPPQGDAKMNVNVILSQIANIVKTKDESKFNFLRETIFGFLGPHWIDGLISGQMSVDFIITLSRSQFGDAFDNEENKLYLFKFVAWLREQAKVNVVTPTPSNGNGVILAKCSKCNTEWDLTKEEWTESKNCDNCGAPLIEVQIPKPEPVESPVMQ